MPRVGKTMDRKRMLRMIDNRIDSRRSAVGMVAAESGHELSLGAWDARPIMYAEWVRLARQHHDQDFVWRQHELIARKNHRDLDAFWLDLGGES